MKNRLQALTCFLCLSGLGLGLAPSHAAENPLAGLDRYIEQGMKSWNLPGLALAVVKGDEMLLMRGYGTREIGKDLPVDEHTIFAVGSTSKAFTSLAVGLLVQEGKISWDDRVIDRLKDFQMYDPWVTAGIRVRDLLCNRSGLPVQTELLWYATDLSRRQIVDKLRYARPEASFRYTYAYRNTMFITAGEVIHAVSGKSWEDFVSDRIFKPLGMTRSTTSVRDLAGQDNVASPHTEIAGKLVPIPYRNIDNASPAGGINSSIRDMAEWLRLHVNQGVHDGKRFVDAEVIAETHAQHTPINHEPKINAMFPTTRRLDYCLSWLTLDHRGSLLVWHNGEIDGMHAVIGFFPEEKVGAVILSNSERQHFHEALFMHVSDLLLGRDPMDWSRIYREFWDGVAAKTAEGLKQIEASRKPNTHPSLPLKAYAGAYSDRVYGPIRIAAEGKGLVFYFSSHLIADLEHWHYDTFRGTWRDRVADARTGKLFLTFNLDGQGTVESVNMDDTLLFERVEQPPTK